MNAPSRWYFNRLRAMSARELAWRVAGTFRRRLRVEVAGQPDWLADPWRCFVGDLVATRGDAWVADAERVANGELSLWGHRAYVAPRSPRWEADPLDGTPFRASSRDWSRDAKPLLDLHRHQHLMPLAAGAACDGRGEWARVCGEQLLDWIDRNPRGQGPGWSSGYESAHRLVGWSWIVPLIAEFLSPSERDLIAASYVEQVAFTFGSPSRFSSANNHRLVELVGLLAADVVGVRTMGWAALWEELEEETARQTYRDGGSREQASGYFLYVLETLWLAGVLARGSGRTLGRLEERLASMLAWLERVAGDAGEPPPLGDDAEDRIIRLSYFKPRGASAIAGRVRALLEGRSTLDPGGESPRAEASSVLPESGLAVFRSRLDGAPVRVVTDVGELGFATLAAHGHADALSVLLDVGERELLRDSGTYSYAPAEGRDDHRRSLAHSTVSVDGRSQAEIWGPHLWGPRFRVHLEAWSLDARLDYVRAAHDGFRRHPSGAVHTRSVGYLKPDLVVVLDRITARRECSATIWWQLPPGDSPERLGDGLAAMTVESVPGAPVRVELGPFSPRYRTLVQAPRLTAQARGVEIVFATLIALASRPPRIEAISHESGVTTLETTDPRPMRIREDWRGRVFEVQR